MSRKRLAFAAVLVALLLTLPSALVPVVQVEAYLVTSITIDRTVVEEGDVLTITINIKCLDYRGDVGFIESRIPAGFQFLNIESSQVYRNASKAWVDREVGWYDPLLVQPVGAQMIESHTGLGFTPSLLLMPDDQLELEYKLRANIPGTYQFSPYIVGYEEASPPSPILITVQPRGGELTNLLLTALVAAVVATAISLVGVFWICRTVLRRPVATSAGSRKTPK